LQNYPDEITHNLVNAEAIDEDLAEKIA